MTEEGLRGQSGTQRTGRHGGGSQGTCLESACEQSPTSLRAGEAVGGRPQAVPGCRPCWSLMSLAGVFVGWEPGPGHAVLGGDEGDGGDVQLEETAREGSACRASWHPGRLPVLWFVCF